MNWTTRRTAALATAACLTAISAAALNGKHARSHEKPVHKDAANTNTPKQNPGVKITVTESSTKSGHKTTIDRATHGREPIDLAGHISRGENIARTALAYRGVPYRFGGRSPQSGFDCSGLVQAVCAKWGLYLPRVAGAQFTKGTAVKPADLQPGDLVFFQGTYKRGISHVGIYIGENQFVHAAGHGKGVRISSLSDTYNQRHWAGARRFDLKQLPKAKDEMPVLASEIVVDRPGELAEPRGKFSGIEGRLGVRPPITELHLSAPSDSAPRLR